MNLHHVKTDNDVKMVNDYVEQSKDMFEKAGFINIKADNTKSPPASDIHGWVVFEWVTIQKLLCSIIGVNFIIAKMSL